MTLLVGLVLVLRARLLQSHYAQQQRLSRWTRLALRVVAADDAYKLAQAKSVQLSRWTRLALRATAARDASDEQRERQQATRWMRITLKAHAARDAAERRHVVSRQPPDEPAELLCPITGLLFRDPVMILTGHTYERTALTEYWRRRPLLNPMGSDHVASAKMICNFGCRQAVDAWLARHPDVLPGGWETRDISSDSRFSQPQLDELAVSIEAAARRASRVANWGRLAQAGLHMT